jgi:hypothetical protein
MKTSRRHVTHGLLALALCAGLTGASTAASAKDRGDDRSDRGNRGRHHDGRDRDDQRHHGRRDDDRGRWRGREHQERHRDWDGQRGDRDRHHQGDRTWQNRDWQRQGDWRQHDRRQPEWGHQGDRRQYGEQWYGRDRHRTFYAPTYRYSYGGRYYDTNDDGAQILRNALNYGYQQGLRAAQAARYQNSRYDYRGCSGYQDANYGYQGYSIDQSQYSYYFREGFQRGYDDGYYSRARYGSNHLGRVELVISILDGILGLHHLP